MKNRFILVFLLTFSVSFSQQVDFTEFDLENGLHVILHQDNTAPVVITSVMYDVGGKDREEGRTGFAHFFEHLLFEGSENFFRDFIHVDDLCSAIHMIMQNFDYVMEEQGPVVDIGTGHSTLVKSVAKAMGFEGEYRSENPQGERIHTRADMEYLHSLGWGPKRNILTSTGQNVIQFR